MRFKQNFYADAAELLTDKQIEVVKALGSPAVELGRDHARGDAVNVDGVFDSENATYEVGADGVCIVEVERFDGWEELDRPITIKDLNNDR